MGLNHSDHFFSVIWLNWIAIDQNWDRTH